VEKIDYIYQNRTGKKINSTIEKSGSVYALKVKSIRCDDGIFVYYEGAEFPQKGIATPETLFSIDILKAIFIEIFKLRPTLNSFFSAFNRFAEKTLETHILKPEYRMICMKELDATLYSFLIGMGLKEIVASQFSLYFSHLIEYDNAYRLRLIDIMSETSTEKLLARPFREVKYLSKILMYREEFDMKKVQYFINVVLFALLFPKVRRAFRSSVKSMQIKNLQYDNIDKYWAFMREDYKSSGLSYRMRKGALSNYSLPPLSLHQL